MSVTSPSRHGASKSDRPTVVIDGIVVDALHVKTFPVSVPGRDALLEIKDVAALLGLSADYLRNEARNFFPIVEIGGARRIRFSDVLAFIEANTKDERGQRVPKKRRGGNMAVKAA
jgi:hypothetical protein